MKNNPFAKLFYDKFQEEVLTPSIFYGNKKIIKKNPLETKFIERFNRFLKCCGQPLVDTSHHFIPGQRLAQFCSSLRFYMIRNVQNLPNVTSEFSKDKDLISLFDSAAQYLISRNRDFRRRGAKIRPLSDIYDYTAWNVKFQDTRSNVKMLPPQIPETCTAPSLYVFDPTRCSPKADLAQKLFRHEMQDAFSGSKHEDTDIFFIHMPPNYPEEIATSTVLTTLRYPDEYNEADMDFTKQHWGRFLGSKLEYDEDHNIISGYRYEDKDFIESMKNLRIVGYCASTTDAHRCLKAFKNLAEQIYDPQVVSQAMKNVMLVSYAMPPLEKNTDYSGVYFISNDINDPNNPEHVVKTNFPELYPQISVTKEDLKHTDCKISETQSGDYIVASPMPEEPIQMDETGLFVNKFQNRREPITLSTNLKTEKTTINIRKKEWRDGHRLQNSTAANLGHVNHIMFKTVLHNVMSGKRGADLFKEATTTNLKHILSPALAFGQRQKLKN